MFLNLIAIHSYQTAQELVSHDIHNNTYNYKDTFSVEIVPICKDNIVCLPKKLAQKLGNMSQICVVQRVTQTLHLIDPNTCQSECRFCDIKVGKTVQNQGET